MNSLNPKPEPNPLTVRTLASEYKVEGHEPDPNDPDYYPESDGEPLAENTLHLNWIFTIFNALNILFKDREDVFVASDLLWYPIKGNKEARRAPDAMVVFGRPKRSFEKVKSYLQWEEEDIGAAVVFEVKSPSDTKLVLRDKFNFYLRYGVEEYYVCDPDTGRTRGWIRRDNKFLSIANMSAWTSPLLGMHFRPGGHYNILHPNGEPIQNPKDSFEAWCSERERLHSETEQLRSETEQLRSETEQLRSETERALELSAREKQARINAEERRIAAEAQSIADREQSIADREQRIAAEEQMKKMKELMRSMGVDPDAIP